MIFVELLGMDLILLAIVLAIAIPFFMWRRAAGAVLKRNFIAYFTNPTGYIFICVFLFLSGFFAFGLSGFFNNNLATLDGLNKFFPLVMLLFIPALTMGSWSEERKEGTDELLLTMPADDIDIVLGKYFAIVSVFSVSLLLSQISNTIVLSLLALDPEGYVDLDTGLLFANYLGYWMIGLAMAALGMAASFLSKNLTVAFVFGVFLNAPLVALSYANDLPLSGWSQTLTSWSIGGQFDPFTRGVISLSSIVYFGVLTAAALYLCMILIGKRHWYVPAAKDFMILHYSGRFICLLVIAVGLNVIFGAGQTRMDISKGQISSVGADTRTMLKDLKHDHKIRIDAYISAEVPDVYLATKRNLINMLKEFRSSNIQVKIHDNLELHSEEIEMAEKQFGIVPQSVLTKRGGRYEEDQIIMGAAFRSGLERVVVPFFDYGLSVEYELARSIATVAKTKRKTLGVVRTEANLDGGGGGRQGMPKQAILTELEKQYEVEMIDPVAPIKKDKYDVLMVVQPSSLDPQSFNNLLDAIKSGIPTAIFEDPRPDFFPQVTATSEMRRGASPFPGMGGGRPQPKGRIQDLWTLLGIAIPGKPSEMTRALEPDIVWQQFNPYPKLARRGISEQWIFVPTEGISDEDHVTSGLSEIFFPVAGAIEEYKGKDNTLEFTPLVRTVAKAGRIDYSKYVTSLRDPRLVKAQQGPVKGPQTIAARIRGPIDPALQMNDEPLQVAMQDKKDKDGEKSEEGVKKDRELHVIYVADIDLMFSAFFSLRARPDAMMDIKWKFENVTFLLNIIDSLAGDDAFVSIRKRQPRFSTLKRIESFIDQARDEQEKGRETAQKELDDTLKELEKDEKGDKLRAEVQRLTREGGNRVEVETAKLKLAAHQRKQTRYVAVEKEKQERALRREILKITSAAERKIQGMKVRSIAAAIWLPPIPPLLLAFVVFIVRRVREREGAHRERLR